MQDQNIGLRLGVIAILALGGLVFFPLFFVAAFVAWALFKDLTDPDQPDADSICVRRLTTTAADPEWKSYFLPFCESPAESAFLEAMIAAYGLTPDKGALTSSGLTMTLQAELQRYRVDFLVNDWLVVEIDGAAYHSSPEAVARDQDRDQDLQSRGYRVLRIPAKTVFATPAEAVRQVRAAIAVGKPVRTSANQQPTTTWSLGQTLTSIDKFVTDLNSHVASSMAVEAATRQSREAFDCEKSAIDTALRIAVRRQNSAAKRAQSTEYARLFDEAYAEVEALFENDKPITKQSVPAILAPPPHQSPAIDAEIERAHQRLMSERSKYFEGVRQRLSGDRRLGELVKEALEEIGYPDCWITVWVTMPVTEMRQMR